MSKTGWNDRLGLKALGLKDRKTRNGARGRTWTGTVFPPTDFKSVASTNFATRAYWRGLFKILFPSKLSAESWVGYTSHRAADYTWRKTELGMILSQIAKLNLVAKGCARLKFIWCNSYWCNKNNIGRYWGSFANIDTYYLGPHHGNYWEFSIEYRIAIKRTLLDVVIKKRISLRATRIRIKMLAKYFTFLIYRICYDWGVFKDVDALPLEVSMCGIKRKSDGNGCICLLINKWVTTSCPTFYR